MGVKHGVHDWGGEDGRSRNISGEVLVVVLSFGVGPAGVRRGGVESC